MNFKIVVKDKKRGTITIPLPQRKLHKLFDIMYMIDGSDAMDTIKLNRMEDTFRWFHTITDHFIIDVIGGGLNPREKKIHYLTKKPNWKKA